MVFRSTMPYLGLDTLQTKDGLVHGGTSLLGQGATQGQPILGPTPDMHLQELIPGKRLPAPTLAQEHMEPTLGSQEVLGPTRLLDSQVVLELTLVPALTAPLLDHCLCLMTCLCLEESCPAC